MGGIQYVFITALAVILIALIGQRRTSAETPIGKISTNVSREFFDSSIVYKVEINNELSLAVNDVTAKLVTYPKYCMEFVGEEKKATSKIGPGKSEILEFRFVPIKDYVEGQIQFNVSYIDASGDIQTVHLEPFNIQLVCALLNPIEIPIHQFDLLLSKMDALSEDVILEAQPEVMFERAQALLTENNFFIVDTEIYEDEEQYTGIIRGFAVGMYIQKKIAIILTITRTLNVDCVTVKVQAHGDDIVMLHTAINEIASELEMKN
jgi:hypothetical protein